MICESAPLEQSPIFEGKLWKTLLPKKKSLEIRKICCYICVPKFSYITLSFEETLNNDKD